jgi:predicted permease
MADKSTILKIINKTVLWLLIVLCILTTIGLLNFGYGLGNIIYILPIILIMIAQVIITRRLYKQGNDKYWIPLIVFNAIVCIYIIYNATIGRGSEFSWDGDIFFVK